MDKTTHSILGAVSGAGLAIASGWPWWQALAGAGLAAVTAGGRFSPDTDQYRWFRALDRWLPDELLGHGGPLGHRRLSHFWGLPLAALCVAFIAVPHAYVWITYALIAGWASHLVGDFFMGRACPYDGRGPGIPFWPWWGHVGAGLKSGGWVERFLVAPVLVAVLAWEAWSGVGAGVVGSGLLR